MKKYITFLFLNCIFINQSIYSQNADITILRSITLHRNLHYESLNKALSFSVTPLSIAAPLAILSTGLLTKNKKTIRDGIYVSVTLIGASVVTTVLKHTINRPRPFTTYPDIIKLDKGGSPSFPSGHTSSAFTLATSLSIAYKHWYVVVPAYLWAGSVAYSRMYLGVHYPTDVLGGMIVGAGSAWLSYEINKRVFPAYK